MAEGRITKKTVDHLICSPGKDRECLWDDTLTGFGVIVYPTGKRVYAVQYRLDGRSRRMSLGEHGRLTPDEARARAKKVLGQVAVGEDPLQERQDDRNTPTFGALASEYLNDHGKKQIKPATLKAYTSKLDLHLLPTLRERRIRDIRAADLKELMASWSNTPAGANRTLAVFSSVWNWAAKTYEDLELPICPSTKVGKYQEEPSERFLSEDELLRLGEVLHEAETAGLPYEIDETKPKAKHAAKPENRLVKINLYVIAAIRLLILTGARLGEIVKATWDEVDLKRGTLTLTRERSKAKRRSKERFKVIQLSPAAVDILKALPRIEGNPYVICGSKAGRPRSDMNKPWRAILKAAKIEKLRDTTFGTLSPASLPPRVCRFE